MMMEMTDKESRTKYFPVTLFSIVMGLSGFTIALNKFYHLQWFPLWPYISMLYFTTAVFFLLLVCYSFKLILYPEEVMGDYQHKIRMSFVPTISISLLLLSIAYLGLYPLVSVALWLLGTVLHAVLTFHIISKWITHDFEIHHFNPAWFIPLVGNILIPIIGVMSAPVIVSAFFFSLGIFFWIIMSTIVIYRLVFHKTMPEKFKPTLFILLAPPAIGFISYMRITMSYDFFAQILLLIVYFFFILLIFLSKSYRKIPFFISWWAYTFPLASFTIASVVAYQITKQNIFSYIAWFGMFLLFVVIFIVSVITLKQIKNHKICVEED